MPRLSEIGDSDAVDDRYSAKVIVYVEAEDDANIFYGLTGEDVREYLEFKPVKAAGGGSGLVATEVRERRPRNSRIFGLLDGEEAAGEGAIAQLIDCSSALFRIAGATNDGFIFLSHHEAENILLMHGDLPGLIRKEATIARSAALSDDEIRQRIVEAVRHFFQAALFKYASRSLNHASNLVKAESGCKVVDSARFLDPRSRRDVLKSIRESIEAEGIITWQALEAEVTATWKLVRKAYVGARPDVEFGRTQRLRLSDGKSVVKRLAKLSGGMPGKWANHLLEDAKRSDFAGQFREELLEITRATA
jgi:hypothetical protein